ncbi:hypothetical protein NEDG_01346 [Nematocida displodere]|uniref:Uncharacterized protein n=1 Tax=Nematocida displodere TaxID=1805483 RepID=A0A177EBE5_9MICR|nr:hypothetical protein NEDG_01346 [Nematocida displodere]
MPVLISLATLMGTAIAIVYIKIMKHYTIANHTPSGRVFFKQGEDNQKVYVGEKQLKETLSGYNLLETILWDITMVLIASFVFALFLRVTFGKIYQNSIIAVDGEDLERVIHSRSRRSVRSGLTLKPGSLGTTREEILANLKILLRKHLNSRYHITGL